CWSEHIKNRQLHNLNYSLCFTDITLKPEITIRPGDDINRAQALHHRAHDLCFIANSLNFPITCQPVITHSQNG
ncbi:OsmC family protein, partial [Raoultella sp. T31]|uniref:OsmC family protein n=1 Tax=Raoultella sp. T31 TaxID=2054594 RepID=UPI003A4D2E9F